LSQGGPDELVPGCGIDCRRLDRASGAGRSGLAHAANSAGCPDEADPDVGLELSARDPTRANRCPDRALQREVLDVQRGNPAICVVLLPRLRPKLLPAQLVGWVGLFIHARPQSPSYQPGDYGLHPPYCDWRLVAGSAVGKPSAVQRRGARLI
jgi:hypothetical protein